MNIKKLMSKTALVAVSIGLAAVSAHAGPPRDSGTDVIGEAQASCGFASGYALSAGLGSGSDEEIRAAGCDLLWKTDGALDTTTRGCTSDRGITGNGFVTYSERNCEKNESAQERQASSIVTSMDDVINKGKAAQTLAAAKAACEYAAKADYLESVGKLDLGGNDLISDADAIAAALGWDCADLGF